MTVNYFWFRHKNRRKQNQHFLSNFTLNSFSASLLLILNLSTFILILSFVLTSKWHLSALLFKRLFSNNSNKPLDACWRDVIRSSTLSTIMYGVLSSAELVISMLFTAKNKSAKKTLNRSGLSIEPCGTPKMISNHVL